MSNTPTRRACASVIAISITLGSLAVPACALTLPPAPATATATATTTSTATAEPTATDTAIPPTGTATATETAIATEAPSSTPTELPTATATFAPTDTPSAQATNTPASVDATYAFPLRLSDNKRYLVDSTGKPFLMTGEAVWSLGTSITLGDVDYYLDDRKARGYNTILINLLDDSRTTLLDGTAPFDNSYDFDTVNTAYFDHFAEVIQHAQDRNMLVVLAPLYLGCPDNCPGWLDEMRGNSAEKLRAYGRFVGERFKGFNNIVWVIGGDRNPGNDLGKINETAYGIKEIQPDTLMTAHTWQPYSAEEIYGNESWLDLNNNYVYPFNGPQVYVFSLRDYQRAPTSPFILCESTYEGEFGATAAWVRRQAYWSVFQGSSGQIAGNTPLWFSGDGWKDAMNFEGAVSVGHLAQMLSIRPWWTLVPDGLPDPAVAANHTVVTKGYGTYCASSPANDCGTNYVAAARASDGSLVVAYVPSDQANSTNPNATAKHTLTVDMTQLSGSATAKWFNPTTGAYQTIGTYANTGTHPFTTPGNNGSGYNDWVLIIEVSTPAGEIPDNVTAQAWLPAIER